MLVLADALDAFASALSEARLAVREVEEQAEAEGLEVVDGAIVRRWGIRGDAAHVEGPDLDETIGRLTRRLTRATTLLERRRTSLARCAEGVSRTLR